MLMSCVKEPPQAEQKKVPLLRKPWLHSLVGLNIDKGVRGGVLLPWFCERHLFLQKPEWKIDVVSQGYS